EKDDTGYLVAWYNEKTPNQRLEGIATNAAGENPCQYNKPEWVPKDIPYKFLDATEIVGPEHVDVGPFLQQIDNFDEVTSCAPVGDCIPDNDIKVTQLNCNTFMFDANGGSGNLCYDWTVDGN